MKNKKREIKSYIRILKYFKNTKLSIFIVSITMIISCVLGALNPIISANILTKITEFNLSKALELSFILLGVILFNRLNGYICNVAYLRGFKKQLLLNIRKDMISNILNMETVNFDNHTSGEFSERLRNDPQSISHVLSAVQSNFWNLITDVFVLIYIFYINFFIGFLYLLGISSIFLYEKYAFNEQKKLVKKNKTLEEKNATLLNETMRGIRDIKLLNMINPISNLINDNLCVSNDSEIEMKIKRGIIHDIVNVLKGIIEVLVLIFSIVLIKNNYLNITNLLIIYMYKTNVFNIITCYTNLKEYFVEYKVSADRIFEIMDDKKYTKEKFGTQELKKVNGKIECKNLSFSYGDNKVLNNLNMIIEPNQTIGIVGASGSGKTTLLNLLIKNYCVTDNQVFIDDIDINNLSKNSIRNNISIISQNPYIFNLTIEENLRLVNEKLTKKEMIEACKIAQIHEYIDSLPQKYDTLIGEGGVNLSGGQKQRLAIARALLKKSKIILFDEATSALDNVTQEELQRAINNIKKDYTIVIVAHRLSTIKNCDQIYVIDEGRIVDNGTHEQLLKKSKHYKKLYEFNNKNSEFGRK